MQEDLTILNVYIPNNRTSKHKRIKRRNRSTIIVGDFNILLSVIEKIPLAALRLVWNGPSASEWTDGVWLDLKLYIDPIWFWFLYPALPPCYKSFRSMSICPVFTYRILSSAKLPWARYTHTEYLGGGKKKSIALGQCFFKLEWLSQFPGGFVKIQIAGPHPGWGCIWCSRSGKGPENLHF